MTNHTPRGKKEAPKPNKERKEQRVIHGDCVEVIGTLPAGSVDLIVSSPPYNVGIEYTNSDDEKSWQEYRKQMTDVSKAMFSILRDGGRLCWNIPSFSSRLNLYFLFQDLFFQAGFKQYAEVIWDKKQISSRTAWGSFCSASEPNLLPRHEYILVFYKGSKNHGKGESDINKDNFIKWTDAMWELQPETNSDHPAPFPIELPSRCIQMFSFVGETVLDPFVGSGTTLRAAANLKRKGIGIDISPEYCAKAEDRLRQGVLL